MMELAADAHHISADKSLEIGLAFLERATGSKHADEIVEDTAVAAYMISAAFRIRPSLNVEGVSRRVLDEFVAALLAIVSPAINENVVRVAFDALEQLLSCPDDGFNMDRQAFVGLMGGRTARLPFPTIHGSSEAVVRRRSTPQ